MIHHVGIVTKYKPGFGNYVLSIFDSLDCPIRLLGHRDIPEFQCHCYIYSVGNGTLLELVSPYGGKLLEWLDAHGENSLHHIAIKVDDIYNAMEILSVGNVPLLTKTPVIGVCDTLVNFIHPSYAGVMIEIIQERKP